MNETMYVVGDLLVKSLETVGGWGCFDKLLVLVPANHSGNNFGLLRYA